MYLLHLWNRNKKIFFVLEERVNFEKIFKLIIRILTYLLSPPLKDSHSLTFAIRSPKIATTGTTVTAVLAPVIAISSSWHTISTKYLMSRSFPCLTKKKKIDKIENIYYYIISIKNVL